MSELIDRQSFIEQERKLYCEDCDRRKGTKNGKPNVICYEIGEAPCRACWLDDALGDLEDFPTASPWHRVEEEMPEIGKRVLVSYGGDVQILKRTDSMTYDGKNYWWNEADGLWERVEEGSYWMPIEPPKEEE